MNPVCDELNASAAARRLGVSPKALRLYEKRNLLHPRRSQTGYRVYSTADMTRAVEIVSLRALGLSLSEVARVLQGDARSLATALAHHQAALQHEISHLIAKISRVRDMRADLARGQRPPDSELKSALDSSLHHVTVELPWPWAGESFELTEIRPLNYIVGPVGSGKTRLAQRLAQVLPDAVFLDLERRAHGRCAVARADNVTRALAGLREEGATESAALTALITGLETAGSRVLVVDMVEQGLDHATQEALITHLRRRAKMAVRPLFLMTRSSAILDLAAVGSDETIIFCPANHSAPQRVLPIPGAPGYEAVATCLASPEVRDRLRTPPKDPIPAAPTHRYSAHRSAPDM